MAARTVCLDEAWDDQGMGGEAEPRPADEVDAGPEGGGADDHRQAVQEGAFILTDGGIETRIVFETDIPLPEHV